MKVIIKSKYLYVEPTPQIDIPNGLVVELFEAANDYSEPFAKADIVKGKSKYEKPNKGTVDKPNYNTVKKAWVEVKKNN